MLVLLGGPVLLLEMFLGQYSGIEYSTVFTICTHVCLYSWAVPFSCKICFSVNTGVYSTVQCTHFVLLYVGTAKRPRTAARNVSLNIEHFVNSTLFIGFTLFIVHFV